MKRWQEAAQVYGELARRLDAGQPAAVATLVRVVGSSYRRPGANLLIGADGALLGNVSGGCLEEDLRERALRVLATGRAEQAEYDTGADENVVWGFGLGCEGRLGVWIHPCQPARAAARVRELAARLQGVAPVRLRLSLAAPDESLLALPDCPPDAAAGVCLQADCFEETLVPPPDFVVVGAGEDARPLVRLAAEVGFRVTVVDHRSAYLTPARFPAAHQLLLRRPEEGLTGLPARPSTLVLLMTHALRLDTAWAAAWADTPVCYIGLLGPPARREKILAALPPDAHARCHGPAGLDLGAEGAEQIALSIVAEALAIHRARGAGFLRSRAAPLHDAPARASAEKGCADLPP